MVILDENRNIVFTEYHRHFSEIQESLINMAHKARKTLGNLPVSAMVTGSGGLALAEWIGAEFIQEVIAVSTSIAAFAPETDVAIEIGGEDAKIIYCSGGKEYRMNGICAGGTGSFIDHMAALMKTDATGLDEYAQEFTVIHPIAARCGVFAKSDLQPLINEGIAKPDLAASIFQAVVSQTISVLACGKPIRGNVAFLGGPLHYLPQLRQRFIETLNLAPGEAIVPESAHIFAALGSALSSSDEKVMYLDELIENLQSGKRVQFEIDRLSPLFASHDDYLAFNQRHGQSGVPRYPLASYSGDVFLGIDSGSTTSKLALTGSNGELLYTFYAGNEGQPLSVISTALEEIYSLLPTGAVIRHSCVTGYGEGLVKAAFRIDSGEIETVAHLKAAVFFAPEVDFILDIGGQDMKCMKVKDGAIDSVLLNEACSAGCGSFIETFALSLDQDVASFAKCALFAENPVDLGSRCTVFMNSRVKQAQKEGADVADISAGLAYSAIKNALHKVIKTTDPQLLGKTIVVQGGTFCNDAVLRAFEIISGREAIRPDIAGIMGAYGAALIAREKHMSENEGLAGLSPQKSTLLPREELHKQEIQVSHGRCTACVNSCLLTINRFVSSKDERRFISGNRCEGGTGRERNSSGVPNLFQEKYQRLFSYQSLDADHAPMGTVGIPRVMNIYENYPFWHTFFTDLGFRVVLSPPSSRDLYIKGLESIPSESQCYPAKIAHGHIEALLEQGIDYIFYPCIVFETWLIPQADNCYNCPIVISYPENIKNNVEGLQSDAIRFHNPFLNFNNLPVLIKRLAEEFSDLPDSAVRHATEKAWQEQENYRADVLSMGERALSYIAEHKCNAIVLAGRPYHIDPELHHGIPELITSYGVAVLSEDSIYNLGNVERPLIVRDQWAYHSRLYEAAAFVRTREDIELVQLTSFGCGLDAITADEIEEILATSGKLFTMIKIDEVNNLGSARIRIRSLFAASKERRATRTLPDIPSPRPARAVFTREMSHSHTILAPQMSPIHFNLLQEAFRSCGYNIEIMPSLEYAAIDTGLRYVNNDACYPALIVAGQLLNALNSGNYDLNNVSLLITQTGAGCRDTNYVAFLRKALNRAGMNHIPVISLNAHRLEENPGFNVTIGLVKRAIQSIIYGDLLMSMLLRTRPYEAEAGSADALYLKWDEICRQSLRSGAFRQYSRNVQAMVSEFENLPLRDDTKPKVGIVGEILVKYHPTGNNELVSQLESLGAEVVVPGLLDFILYGNHNATFAEKHLGGTKKVRIISDIITGIIELYRNPVRKAMENSLRFHPPVSIDKKGELAAPIVSLGNQTGEGWFLVAEMEEFIRSGVSNIICAQPFSCLPNHVTGKGVIRELKRRYPLSNIVAIDYDPGASEANQLNRIMLMLSVARLNMEKLNCGS